jgi:opacity protein-like surface antigen
MVHYAAGDHRFADKWKTNMAVFMANGVFTYETYSTLKPYVGAGIGFAYINQTGATSLQTSPATSGSPYELVSGGTDPVNHFNSRTHASDYALAAQAKLGLRAEFDKHWSAFAEYRYLYVDSAEYTFGSTSYMPTGHSPTSNWTVKSDFMDFHTGLVGVDYSF